MDLANFTNDGSSGHIRHVHVGYNYINIKAPLLRVNNRFPRIRHQFHMIAKVRQHLSDDFEDHSIIINKQYLHT